MKFLGSFILTKKNGTNYLEDTRQIQHILRAYSRLPATPNVRSVLYLGLSSLENSLSDEEAQGVRDWLRAGGVLSDFPGPATAQGPPINGDELRPTTNRHDEEPNENEEPLDDNWVSPVQRNLGRRGPMRGEFREFRRPDRRRPFLEVGHHNIGHTPYTHDPNTIEPPLAGSNHQSEQIPGDEDETFDTDLDDYDSEAYLDMDEEAGPNQANGSTTGIVITNDHLSSSSCTETLPENWKECVVCVCGYSPEQFPDSPKITSTCAHDHEDVVCLRCIRMSIQTALREGDLRRIICPLCPEPLLKEEIKKYGTKEIFSRYVAPRLL